MAPDMASTTSWTQRAALLLPVLLLVCGTASAAAVRGQRAHAAANDEAAPLNPLALLVLRALASEDAAPPAAVVLEPAGAGGDDLSGLVDAAPASASSARAGAGTSASRASAVPDGELGLGLGDTAFLRAAKRQVRYHQCYFNPISCFG